MIDSIEKAKKYYLDLDCSKFHMAREFPVSYKEYCSLGISKETEISWSTEKFDEYYESYNMKSSPYEDWIVHSKLVDLGISINSKTVFEKLITVSVNLISKLDNKQLILVGENIANRNDIRLKDNLLYKLIGVGMKDDAVKLKNIVLRKLSSVEFEEQERVQRLIDRYNYMDDIN